MDRRELKPTEKKEVESVGPEETRGIPYFSPYVDIYENQEALVIEADMPGVEGKDVEIDLDDNVLTLQGRIHPPKDLKGLTPFYREYREGNYYRQFVLSEIVDREKISANMSKGVLRVTLPKVEKARPRKIEVKGV
jgi:HSP20 family protein